VSAAPGYSPGWPAGPSDLAGLLAAAEEAVDTLTVNADLATVADNRVALAMGTLTSLVARLDGLRVGLAPRCSAPGETWHRHPAFPSNCGRVDMS
jgi:hypothetical protein